MKIVNIFVLLMVVSLVIFGGISVFVFQKLEEANEEFDNFEEKSKETLLLQRIDRQVHRIWMMSMFLLEAEGIPEEEAIYNQEIIETAQQYNDLFEEFMVGERNYDVSAFLEESPVHDDRVKNVLDAYRTGEEPSIVHQLIVEGRASGNQIIEILDGFQIKASQEAREAERNYLESINSVVKIAFPAMIGIILLMLVGISLLIFSILRPIKILSDSVEDILRGNFEVQLPKSKIDEINIFNKIAKTMKLAVMESGQVKKEKYGTEKNTKKNQEIKNKIIFKKMGAKGPK